ncbi:MFS general substrate transporter [Backusella circina FSU 941]|nr:MFS general substrate transporter [Backusella circina FSU 941]
MTQENEKSLPTKSKRVVDSKIKRTVLLLSMFFCIFCTQFSNAGLGPSLGKISSELHNSEDMSWYMTSFTLTSVVFQLLGVRISDCLGRRRTELYSFTMFFIISFITGFSINNAMFIAGRALQGITAGIAQTNISASLVDLFNMKDRIKYQPMVYMAFTVAIIISPNHLSWRWIFWLTAIICFPVLVSLYFYLQIEIKPEQTISKENLKTLTKRIDPIGCVLVSTAIVFFLMGMHLGGESIEYTWSSPMVIGFLCGSVGLFMLFLIFEKFIASVPLFPSAVIMNKDLILCYIQQFANGWHYPLVNLVLFIEYQAVFGATTTEAALRLVPASILNVVSNYMGTRISYKLGSPKYVNMVGTIINIIASFLLLFVENPSSSVSTQTGIIIMYEFGMGFCSQISVLSYQMILENTHPHLVPVSLSLGRCIVLCGITVSISFSLSLLQSLMTIDIEGLKSLQPAIYDAIIKSGAQINYSKVRNLTPEIAKKTIQQMYHDNIRYIVYSHLFWSIICLICVIFAKVPSLKKKKAEFDAEENRK